MSSRDLFSSPPSSKTPHDSLGFLRHAGDAFQSNTSSASSAISSSSSYRHHQAAFRIPTPTVPQRVLLTDANHEPKTRGAVGILIVGLGGANGTTLLAGITANREKISWRGPRGEHMTPNYYGCITQLEEKGGGVGYKNKIKGLADASMAAVGGWDIRPANLGDALLDAQILDYDLVRQLKDDMNRQKVFRGLYDARFIGSSQHDGATHVLSPQEAPTSSEALKCLRADIRYFKWRNGVVGHTTVIWSASVEPNCEILQEYTTALELLEAIEQTEEERGGPLPPSLLYATAALLERCSFVNGGSQNTQSCPGLVDLAEKQLDVYCLGTDFKAGQTKFKTAAVEYIRTMGLTPKVIASSNHLGNNDMRNLASAPATSKAKLRVKHDIFAPWEEDIDHKVSIMFTPLINDEKRDFVEYTSLGFLGQTHTMVTYTRASDSVLCVPLMIDVAVWCDFFSNRSWSYAKVAKALAYLFKVPEGSAIGVDPGFFRQMEELKLQASAASEAKAQKRDATSNTKKRVRIRPEEKTTEWAIPNDVRIVCAGLACVDMQLYGASGGDGGEGIETFEGEKSVGGGSVSMACKTLARLCHGELLDDGFMQVTPPVVHSIVPLCKIGHDDAGNKLVSLLESCGSEFRNVDTKHVKNARDKYRDARTGLSVLPIYRDGRRGCFFDAASNVTFSPDEMIDMVHGLASNSTGPDLDTSQMSSDDLQNYHDRMGSMAPTYGAFLFGYPHLLPKMQGENLARIFVEARHVMVDEGIVALDLNGVPDDMFSRQRGLREVSDLKDNPILGAALKQVDILHMNEDELMLLTGCEIRGTDASRLDDEYAIESAVDLFLQCGVAVVAVTRGRKGSFVGCNNEARFNKSPMLPAAWFDCTAKLGAVELPPDAVINTNGAGDSFTAGLLVASMLRHTGMTVPQTKEGRPTSLRHDLTNSQSGLFNQSLDLGHLEVSSPRKTSPSKKRSTPYQLYMRENYVTLKKQLNDDKKAIFTRCHEMWENESDDAKALYEHKAKEEAQVDENEFSLWLEDDLEALDATPRTFDAGSSFGVDQDEENIVKNLYMTNRALNLESAVQFASLVAALHVDVSTRDLLHLDIFRLIERSRIVPNGFEEI